MVANLEVYVWFDNGVDIFFMEVLQKGRLLVRTVIRLVHIYNFDKLYAIYCIIDGPKELN